MQFVLCQEGGVVVMSKAAHKGGGTHECVFTRATKIGWNAGGSAKD